VTSTRPDSVVARSSRALAAAAGRARAGAALPCWFLLARDGAGVHGPYAFGNLRHWTATGCLRPDDRVAESTAAGPFVLSSSALGAAPAGASPPPPAQPLIADPPPPVPSPHDARLDVTPPPACARPRARRELSCGDGGLLSRRRREPSW
jgi:hypothetical protein